MDAAELKTVVSRGEGVSTEFKRCGNQPGKDVFETICSFANRQGGTILLGVQDDGIVVGVPAQAALAKQTCAPPIKPTPSCDATIPTVTTTASS